MAATPDSVPADKAIDAKGLTCPLPVLRARKAMASLPVGGVLRVEATDPGAPKDFDVFVRAAAHEMLATSAENGVFVFVIKKGP